MEVENIRKFLAANYSDEKLAALLAHAESGRLGWNSCCCVVGIATATHPLQTATAFGEMRASSTGDWHLEEARRLPYAVEAENEFLHIAWSDAGRRERLLPLIHEEMERRERSEIAGIARDRPFGLPQDRLTTRRDRETTVDQVIAPVLLVAG